MTNNKIVIKSSNGKRFLRDVSDEKLVEEVINCREYFFKMMGLRCIIDFKNRMGDHDLDYMRAICEPEIQNSRSYAATLSKEVMSRELKWVQSNSHILSKAIRQMQEEEQPSGIETTIIHEGQNCQAKISMSAEELVYYYSSMIAAVVSHIEKKHALEVEGNDSILLQAIYFMHEELCRREIGYKLKTA